MMDTAKGLHIDSQLSYMITEKKAIILLPYYCHCIYAFSELYSINFYIQLTHAGELY